jgi:hypothetical protein
MSNLELAATLKVLSEALMGMDRPDEAVTHLQETRSIRERVQPHTTTGLLRTRPALARAWHQLGQTAGAEAAFRRAIADLRGSERNDAALIEPLLRLAAFVNGSDRSGDAETLLAEADAVAERSLPSSHYLVALTRAQYGRWLADHGRYGEAEPHLAAAVAWLTDFIGRAHASTVSVRELLSEVHGRLEKRPPRHSSGG